MARCPAPSPRFELGTRLTSIVASSSSNLDKPSPTPPKPGLQYDERPLPSIPVSGYQPPLHLKYVARHDFEGPRNGLAVSPPTGAIAFELVLHRRRAHVST
ncbi:hypothetical protein HO173_011987 [Letharia columbiana]|uniref:Uncharacterized protein n=1 Tax=Letharia columbiana TaxID=112416 RepID=A0A8H6CQR6_9LECA|nr:uncharacterized protein HO173_011987 [Letharia columbiana]KAF6227769.1 hypothetical protein HO173_011987 [Letharia columbiana]